MVVVGGGTQYYSFHYWLPANITCEKCTLQWAWKTANSCTPHPDAYKCHFQNMARLGWDVDEWCSGVCNYHGSCPAVQGAPTPCGEEFANCADVAIINEGGQGPSPTPPPMPTPATPAPPVTPAPVTPAPAPVSTPAPPVSTPAPPSNVMTCTATPGLNRGVTDAACARCAAGYK